LKLCSAKQREIFRTRYFQMATTTEDLEYYQLLLFRNLIHTRR